MHSFLGPHCRLLHDNIGYLPRTHELYDILPSKQPPDNPELVVLLPDCDETTHRHASCAHKDSPLRPISRHGRRRSHQPQRATPIYIRTRHDPLSCNYPSTRHSHRLSCAAIPIEAPTATFDTHHILPLRLHTTRAERTVTSTTIKGSSRRRICQEGEEEGRKEGKETGARQGKGEGTRGIGCSKEKEQQRPREDLGQIHVSTRAQATQDHYPTTC